MFLHGVYCFLLIGLAELKENNIIKTKRIGILPPFFFSLASFKRKKEEMNLESKKGLFGLGLDCDSGALL